METNTQEKILPKTFFLMFLGLLGTALTAFYTYSSGLYVKIFLGNYFGMLLIAELVVVLLFSFLFRRLSPNLVGILFFLYAMINGVTLASIFVLFDLSSIVWLFLATAALFGGLGLYGYKTNADLSDWHKPLYGVLLVGLVLSIINIFLGNSMLDLVLDWVILFVFFGITIYDMNKIKMLEQDETLDRSKLHIYCAMQLYLDFINIFLRLLSIFGKRRD